VSFVVWAVVVATVVPLMVMPMGALQAQIVLIVAVSIVLLIVLGVQREHRRIEERDRARALPRCRACGQRLDEADPEDAPGTRCVECGRVVG
jgi:membrane protein implicated in regulation of membrane protease activity